MSIPLPKLSPKKRGWVSGDPPVGTKGRSSSQRKSARDGGLTPSERRQKDKLMRQFQRMPEGQSGNSTAYVNSEVWCTRPGCHRMNGTHSHGLPELNKRLEEIGRELGSVIRKAVRR